MISGLLYLRLSPRTRPEGPENGPEVRTTLSVQFLGVVSLVQYNLRYVFIANIVFVFKYLQFRYLHKYKWNIRWYLKNACIMYKINTSKWRCRLGKTKHYSEIEQVFKATGCNVASTKTTLIKCSKTIPSSRLVCAISKLIVNEGETRMNLLVIPLRYICLLHDQFRDF